MSSQEQAHDQSEVRAPARPGVRVSRRRTGWDLALGVLLILGGLLVSGNVVLATAVSVVLLGWTTLFSGIFAVVVAVVDGASGRRDHLWLPLLSGALLAVLGLAFLRNPAAAALTLTLLTGSLFLVSGLVRVVAAFQLPRHRWLVLVGGAVSVVLGLVVVLNLVAFSLTLLGVLLAVQLLVDGVSLVVQGRLHVDPV